MGLVYNSVISDFGATTAQDWCELLAPSDATCLIHSIKVNQRSDTDSEQMRLIAKRCIGGTSGSGGTTVTPTPICPGAPAAGAVVERNNTTVYVPGTEQIALDEGFNIVTGFEHYFQPPLEISPGQRFVVNLPNTPADIVQFCGTMQHEEVGG